MLIPLTGPSRPPLSGGKPRRLVILLHGLGADGNDLIGLQQYWGRLVPDAEFISPNAPFPCDMAPYGYQWFSVQDRSPATVLAGVRAAAPMLDGFIDEELQKRGFDESDAALVGFSQGTMMALYVGLRRAKPLAGIVGFSGMLAGPEILKDEIKSRPSILLAHGDSDEMLPHVLTERAAEALRQNGVPVVVHIAQGVGHGINETALSHAARFLLEAFKIPLPK